MPLLVTPATIAANVVGTLPDGIPPPPEGATQELLDYHKGMSDWYSAFLIAYNSQQRQLLSKITAP